MPEHNVVELLSASLFVVESAFLDTRGAPITPASLEKTNALAVAYSAAGRFEDALPYFELAAHGCQRLLGPDHIDTLIATGNIAATYGRLGRWSEALPLLEENVATRARVLGEQHPATATARDALAVAYRLAGRLPEAIALHQQVVAQRTAMLGPTHPDTLMSTLGLAVAVAEMGSTGPAANQIATALTEAERTEGAELVAIALRVRFADLLMDLGQPDGAVAHMQHAIGDAEVLHGTNHPETTALRSYLSHMDAGRDGGR